MGTTELDMQRFHRGAEADLFLTKIGPWKAVVKRRVRKKYRIAKLDQRIRSERTIREANALRDAKRAGVRAPSVLSVDMKDFAIAMSFVDGEIARSCLDQLPRRDQTSVLYEIGQQIGALHEAGLVHGDMTTSNVIISRNGLPFILDFGMSSHSTDPEDQATDLHLLQRSISTSHALDSRRSEKPIREGYRHEFGDRQASITFLRQKEIARRGRYFAIR
jgi:TP53 regulating kinase and related kinases